MSRKVKDTELYDILGVAPEATDIELKKAYRKKAIQYHPDKNPSPEAETMFKEVGEAYQILSNPDSRAFYDKVGRSAMKKTGGEEDAVDPQEIFSKMFGGEAFYDYIGEISLVKDFTSTMDVVMTPEERAEMEAAEAKTNGEAGDVPLAAPGTAETTTATPAVGETATAGTVPTESNNNSLAHHSSFSKTSSTANSGTTTPIASGSSSDQLSKKAHSGGVETPKKHAAKPKITPEQRAALDALEAKRDEEKKKRVNDLKEKLVQRIRPFVEAKHPGEINDPETKAFEGRIRTEAEDLKLESFGIELLHTIATVYITKAGNFVKAKKFFGGGFFGRLKEKGGMVKEGWGLLGSALGVQTAMQEMERLEQKGDATPEQLEALAQELSSKMLLTTWKATRWEVTNVVGAVVEEVLYEPGLSKDLALRRAKAIMTIGGIFKSVEPDESDEERRELERLVMNAGNKKKKAEKEKEKADKEKKSAGGWGWGKVHTEEKPTTAVPPTAGASATTTTGAAPIPTTTEKTA